MRMKQKETKKKEKKQKKKKDPNALKTSRVIADNLFVLRLIHSVAPSYLPTYFLWSVAIASLDFLLNVWLLREVVNRYSLDRPDAEVIGLLIGLVLTKFLVSILTDMLPRLLYPRYMQRIVEKIESELFRKAADVELECYENPDFYDKYVKAMDNTYSRCMDVVYTVESLIWSTVTLASTSMMLFIIDPVFIVFGLIPLLFGLIRDKRNKTDKERNDERRKLERREGYVQRAFYLNEFPNSLENVSLTLHRGEKIAIVGYNGAGKTTLTKLLMRLYDPSEGEIL